MAAHYEITLKHNQPGLTLPDITLYYEGDSSKQMTIHGLTDSYSAQINLSDWGSDIDPGKIKIRESSVFSADGKTKYNISTNIRTPNS